MKLWRRQLLIILLANILMVVQCYAGPKPPDSSATDQERMQRTSRYGLVQLRRVGSFLDHTFDIYLNARKLFTLNTDHAFLISQHVFGDIDALLIGQMCGGSQCGALDLKFLVIYPDGKGKLIGDEDFRSEFGGVEELSRNEDRVVLDLGYAKGKVKKATFDGKELAISYQQSTVMKSIPAVDCRETFNVAYQACKERDDCQADTTDFLIGQLAGVEWRRFDAISNQQGFGMARFIALCNKACTTKTLGAYPDYERQVCNSDGSFTPGVTTARSPLPKDDGTKKTFVAQAPKPEKQREQSQLVGNEATFGPWRVVCNVDRILDRKHCYALQTKGSGIVVSASDLWNWSINLGDGPFYPGSLQLVRVDSGEVFRGRGKFDNVKRIVDQMRTGKIVQTRSYGWPNHDAIDDIYSLKGLDDALRYFERYFRAAK